MPNPQSRKRGREGGGGRGSSCSFDFFFSNTFEQKQLLFTGLPFLRIFINYT